MTRVRQPGDDGQLKRRATSVSASYPHFLREPDLPTVAEQGFPGFKITNSYGLFAPAGTPRPIVNAINRLVGEFMHSPQIAQKLVAEGSAAAERISPEHYRAFFARDYEEVERQIKQIKVKLY